MLDTEKLPFQQFEFVCEGFLHTFDAAAESVRLDSDSNQNGSTQELISAVQGQRAILIKVPLDGRGREDACVPSQPYATSAIVAAYCNTLGRSTCEDYEWQAARDDDAKATMLALQKEVVANFDHDQTSTPTSYADMDPFCKRGDDAVLVYSVGVVSVALRPSLFVHYRNTPSDYVASNGPGDDALGVITYPVPLNMQFDVFPAFSIYYDIASSAVDTDDGTVERSRFLDTFDQVKVRILNDDGSTSKGDLGFECTGTTGSFDQDSDGTDHVRVDIATNGDAYYRVKVDVSCHGVVTRPGMHAVIEVAAKPRHALEDAGESIGEADAQARSGVWKMRWTVRFVATCHAYQQMIVVQDDANTAAQADASTASSVHFQCEDVFWICPAACAVDANSAAYIAQCDRVVPGVPSPLVHTHDMFLDVLPEWAQEQNAKKPNQGYGPLSALMDRSETSPDGRITYTAERTVKVDRWKEVYDAALWENVMLHGYVDPLTHLLWFQERKMHWIGRSTAVPTALDGQLPQEMHHARGSFATGSLYTIPNSNAGNEDAVFWDIQECAQQQQQQQQPGGSVGEHAENVNIAIEIPLDGATFVDSGNRFQAATGTFQQEVHCGTVHISATAPNAVSSTAITAEMLGMSSVLSATPLSVAVWPQCIPLKDGSPAEASCPPGSIDTSPPTVIGECGTEYALTMRPDGNKADESARWRYFSNDQMITCSVPRINNHGMHDRRANDREVGCVYHSHANEDAKIVTFNDDRRIHHVTMDIQRVEMLKEDEEIISEAGIEKDAYVPPLLFAIAAEDDLGLVSERCNVTVLQTSLGIRLNQISYSGADGMVHQGPAENEIDPSIDLFPPIPQNSQFKIDFSVVGVGVAPGRSPALAVHRRGGILNKEGGSAWDISCVQKSEKHGTNRTDDTPLTRTFWRSEWQCTGKGAANAWDHPELRLVVTASPNDPARDRWLQYDVGVVQMNVHACPPPHLWAFPTDGLRHPYINDTLDWDDYATLDVAFESSFPRRNSMAYTPGVGGETWHYKIRNAAKQVHAAFHTTPMLNISTFQAVPTEAGGGETELIMITNHQAPYHTWCVVSHDAIEVERCNGPPAGTHISINLFFGVEIGNAAVATRAGHAAFQCPASMIASMDIRPMKIDFLAQNKEFSMKYASSIVSMESRLAELGIKSSPNDVDGRPLAYFEIMHRHPRLLSPVYRFPVVKSQAVYTAVVVLEAWIDPALDTAMPDVTVGRGQKQYAECNQVSVVPGTASAPWRAEWSCTSSQACEFEIYATPARFVSGSNHVVPDWREQYLGSVNVGTVTCPAPYGYVFDHEIIKGKVPGWISKLKASAGSMQVELGDDIGVRVSVHQTREVSPEEGQSTGTNDAKPEAGMQPPPAMQDLPQGMGVRPEDGQGMGTGDDSMGMGDAKPEAGMKPPPGPPMQAQPQGGEGMGGGMGEPITDGSKMHELDQWCPNKIYSDRYNREIDPNCISPCLGCLLELQWSFVKADNPSEHALPQYCPKTLVARVAATTKDLPIPAPVLGEPYNNEIHVTLSFPGVVSYPKRKEVAEMLDNAFATLSPRIALRKHINANTTGSAALEGRASGPGAGQKVNYDDIGLQVKGFTPNVDYEEQDSEASSEWQAHQYKREVAFLIIGTPTTAGIFTMDASVTSYTAPGLPTSHFTAGGSPKLVAHTIPIYDSNPDSEMYVKPKDLAVPYDTQKAVVVVRVEECTSGCWFKSQHDDGSKTSTSIKGTCDFKGNNFDNDFTCTCPPHPDDDAYILAFNALTNTCEIDEAASTSMTKAAKRRLAVSILVPALILLILLFAAYRYYLYWYKMRPINFEDFLASMIASGEMLPEQGSLQKKPREIRRRDLTLLQVIGTGKFGEVYKCLLDEMEGRGVPEHTVAAKTVKSPAATVGDKAASEAEAGKADLLAEATVMSQVAGHPNIGTCVHNVDHSVHKGTPIL